MNIIEKSKQFNQKQFEKFLDDSCKKYYNNEPDDDIIDDKIYDKLVNLYENKFNIKYKKIGYKAIATLSKSKLPYYMGSLDKIKTEHSLNLWIKKNIAKEYVIMDKIDGISVLYYNNNNENFLFKRSDGIIGSNISHLIKYFKLPIIKNCAIRGELVITKKEFEKYKDVMSNSRN